MSRQERAQQDKQRGIFPGETVFEGGEQETVEILPSVDTLSPREREEGVTARVGRDRVERRIQEGSSPPPAPPAADDREDRDELMMITYRLAGYFTLVVAAVLLAGAVGWVITSNVAL